MSELLEYKCPCCGGSITFDSDSQQMKCPYCETEFDMETLKAFDEELKNEKDSQMDWEEASGSQWQEGEEEGMAIYTCESCGGEIIADENTAATTCPFCDSPVIMTRKLSGELRPDYVIPFQLDKKAAKQKLFDHFKGKKLLPKVFKDQNHIDEIKGIYVPFWLFDTDVNAHMRYKGQQSTHWSDSDYRYTQTRYFSLIRGGELKFQHVPADGSTKMADDLMESLEPFDFSKAVDFQTAYLAGYLADKYDVPAQQCIERVNQRVKQSTQDTFASTTQGYHSVVLENGNIQLANGTTKYALLPVWILNTSWNGNKYTFAMNGQTGKFVGNLPVDWGIYWRWFASLTAIVGAVVYGLLWLI